MSNYISPYALELTGRSGRDKALYRDYLQAKSLTTDVTASVDEVRYSISQSSQEMIATAEQLHERGYKLVASAIGDLAEGVGDGFADVSWKLDEISEGITELNATFDWGFSQMIAAMGRVNDSLKELIAIAKTPAETWAYEQFEIARDAIRRGLYPEAVEALLRSVNGHGDHVGYKLEYRFHHTLGVLYLGDVRNTDATILDLAKSEASFLTAARYARADYPMEASVALTAAGWAAYCQNKLAEAESHTNQAVALNPQNGEAFYQLAKVEMHTDRPKEAIPNLRRAAELDPHYTVKAATDPDFLRFEGELQSLIDSLRRDAESKAAPLMAEAKRVFDGLGEWETEKVFDSEMKLLKDAFVKLERNYCANTFFGFLDAKPVANRVASLGTRLLKEQEHYLEKEVNEVIARLSIFQELFETRGTRFSYDTFKTANELLGQVKTGVRTHSEYVNKINLLKQAREQYSQSVEESRQTILKHKSRAETTRTVIGAVIGALVGYVPVSVFVPAFLGLFAAFFFDHAGEWQKIDGPVSIGLRIIGVAVAALTGAVAFKETFSTRTREERLFGSEPLLPSIYEIQQRRAVSRLNHVFDAV